MESLRSSVAWSMQSKALERFSKTRAVICFLSIASSTLAVNWILKVSVECTFLLPRWWDVRRLLSKRNVLN